jgi:Flp pilus assembly CpaE family ATPase
METTTAALVGVAGGAGATRLATETAAVLAPFTCLALLSLNSARAPSTFRSAEIRSVR